ncbi:MAG: DUF4139 domain-containing protein [Verrucomicrobia bacterium]|nr:DUF4139 domain-containing protein [Verrucomicrobiota bacterium]
MNHINADQLRNYAFDLFPETEMQATAAHLETCTACREKLQALETQFQALDVLQDQPGVSMAVVEQCRRKAADRSTATRQDASSTFFWKPALAIAATLLVAFGLFRFTSPTAGGPPAPSLAELRAEQPFAPASNIELNVLPRRDDVQLTIYNAEDLTLVRETRKLVLKQGWNWLQFMWSNTLIDPTSLMLEPQTHTDQIEITQLVYPPRLNDMARWSIFSEISGEVEFELTYFTSGLKWNAFYEATLAPDEQSMQLKSYVRVDNGSGEDYENAQIRLVVGVINLKDIIAHLAEREHSFGVPDMYSLTWDEMEEIRGTARELGINEDEIFTDILCEARCKLVKKEGLSEYQLYTIEGRETIPDGWGKRLPSFTAQEIGVTNLYKFEVERWGPVTMRYLSFANTQAHQLGETPLPKGRVRVFGNVDGASSSVSTGEKHCSTQSAQGMDQRQSPIHNGAGSSVYIGASSIKYIPVGEEIELELGVARKVKVKPKLMRTRTENHVFDSKGNVSGWDEITNWKIEMANARDLPIEIEIMRGANSNHWSIQTDAPFEKYDVSHFRFLEKLEPRSKKIIEYELTVYHGTRIRTTNGH